MTQPYIYHTYNTTHVYNGLEFEITLQFEEEDLPIEDTFDDAVDNIADLHDKINNGTYVYFCAHMIAYYRDVELANDYLGACLYDSYDQFIEQNDYYADMINNVTDVAFSRLPDNIKSTQASHTNVHTTFWEDADPTFQIKGDYIYAFSNTDTKGMSIADLVTHILTHGETIS